MNSSAVEDAFAAILDRHITAITQRDLETFEATLAEDVRLIGTDGSIIEGRADAVDAHRRWFADPGWRFEPHVLFSDSRDAVGWALVRVLYQTSSIATEFYLFLLFAQHESDGQRRLLYDQGTALRQSIR